MRLPSLDMVTWLDTSMTIALGFTDFENCPQFVSTFSCWFFDAKVPFYPPQKLESKALKKRKKRQHGMDNIIKLGYNK